MTQLAHPEAAVTPKEERRRKPLRNEGRAAFGFLTPSVAGLTLFLLFPSVLAVVTSFFHWPTFGNIEFAGLDNYRQLTGEGATFPAALRNTVLFTALVVPVNLVVTLSLAFWIAGSRFSRIYRVLLFLPVVTPTVATAVIWMMLYQPNGIVDYLAGAVGLNIPNILASQSTALVAVAFVVLWQGLGYNVLIFSAAIDQLPEDVINAAKIDGAGVLRTLFQIKIPLVTPAVFFATTITMIQSFQIFTEPFMMTAGGPGDATVTVVMDIYQTAFRGGQLGLAAAPAMVLFALIIIFTLAQWAGQRKWVHYG
ncbi:carbohydrate ABC transporter permease [Pseudactinotalea sp. Z1748]|uniref:carbohydrate ABC transporter permease n=1 Tax=Pseudactinotalea sp. Z1748 TaxID=3413027 RepID=UPI003C7A85F0